MKPYTTLEEALASRKPGKRGYTLLDGENGCTNGCRCGVSIYDNTEFMCLKGKEPQDLETLKLILSPEMHLLHLPE